MKNRLIMSIRDIKANDGTMKKTATNTVKTAVVDAKEPAWRQEYAS
jgi:hypothetical protein